MPFLGLCQVSPDYRYSGPFKPAPVWSIRSVCAADFPVADTSLYLELRLHHARPRFRSSPRAASSSRARRRADPARRHAEEDQRGAGAVRAADQRRAPDEIGFLFATSEGENVVARALAPKAGRQRRHRRAALRNRVRAVSPPGEDDRRRAARREGTGTARSTAKDLEPLVDRRTRLVSVAWVSHQNGFRHDMRPIADLAHAHGALVLHRRHPGRGHVSDRRQGGRRGRDVRAAPTSGCSAASAWRRSTCGARCSIASTLDRFGALHVEQRAPRSTASRSTRRPGASTTRRCAFGPVYQLGAGLDYLERVGVDRIEAHTVALAQRLRPGSRHAGFERDRRRKATVRRSWPSA